MPTARLVDINTAAITYRTKILMALDKRKYRNCIGGIIALNSLLPEDDTEDETKNYRIRINSEEYYEKINEKDTIVCPSCDKEISYESVQVFPINTSLIDRVITDKKEKDIWICPKCKKENDVDRSRLIVSTLQKPYYLRVVPDPPRNDHGLLSKLDFHHKMEEWVWMCLGYIEEGFTRFRDDNWNKADPFDQLYEVDTNLEESES